MNFEQQMLISLPPLMDSNFQKSVIYLHQHNGDGASGWIVNKELDNLETFLNEAVELLEENGRLCVISYHSLEDRIVKHTFKEFAKLGFGKILTKKPVIAEYSEIRENRRSRSAKLRVFEKSGK